MIYIVSEKRDLMTDLVIEWVKAKGKSFKRFNDDEFVKDCNSLLQSDIRTLWLRRGTFNVLPERINRDFFNRSHILKYLNSEIEEYSIYVEYMLKKKLGENYVGSFEKEVSSNNKLINLDIANQVGFKTPLTLITSSKKELQSFYKKHKQIISKDLKAPVNIRTRHKALISTGVKLIDVHMLAGLEDYFVPIFVQEYVEKKYEVRVFVFSDKMYAMAIFSQKDEQTKIDYRNYNNSRQNRCVPFVLSKTIQNKIRDFMDKTDMNTGSIDLIVTPNNEFCFLEINPMGQFHWLSANCNYYIEKDIANFLTA